MEDHENEKQNVAENQKNEVQKIPTPKVKASKSQFKVWIENGFIQSRVKNIKRLFRNPAVLKILNRAISDSKYHPIPPSRFDDILRNENTDTDKWPFDRLTEKLYELQNLCGIHLFIGKIKDDEYRFKDNNTISKSSGYQVKGSTLKSMGAKTCSAKSECPINKIEIHDLTPFDKKAESLFLNLFSELEDGFYPTIIEYRYGHRKAMEKVLMHIPSSISVSKLFDIYSEKVRKEQENFYGMTFRGRRKTKPGRQKIILETYKRHEKGFRKQKLSKSAQSNFLSKQLKKRGIDLAPITIRRHYLDKMIEQKMAKR